MLILPTLVLYHTEYSSRLPLRIYKAHSNTKKPVSHHPPSIYSTIQFQDTHRAVSELLTSPPPETALWAGLQLQMVPFAFSPTDAFPISLGSASFPPFREVVLYMCNTLRFLCHIPHSILGSPNLLKAFFFLIAYIKVCSSGCKVLCGLTNAYCQVFIITVSNRIILLS